MPLESGHLKFVSSGDVFAFYVPPGVGGFAEGVEADLGGLVDGFADAIGFGLTDFYPERDGAVIFFAPDVGFV